MRLVIDKNRFESQELREFLNSRENEAVLMGFSFMESLKGDALENVPRSTSLLREFPGQVLVLKDTYSLMRMGLIAPERVLDMIDKKATREFGLFCAMVESAGKGDHRARSFLSNLGRSASEHYEKLLEDGEWLWDGVLQTTAKFPEAIATRHRREQLNVGQWARMVEFAIAPLGESLFSGDKNLPSMPMQFVVSRHYYRMRYCMALWWLAFRWAVERGPSGISRERLKNDLIDLSYIVAGSYFDGVMSEDGKVLDLYEDVRLTVEYMDPVKWGRQP